MPPLIDIILPVRNEAQSLPKLLSRIHVAFHSNKAVYRVIAIDDQSTDSSFEILTELTKKYPLKVYKKKGKLGKAYSIIEGAKHGDAPFIAMIDADLEYPPEALPVLLEIAKQKGMAVARRVSSHQSKVRVFLSKGFQFLFGRLMFGFKCDVQSGLKVFRREVIEYIDPDSISGWTIDIPLLEATRGLNLDIGEVSITFSPRKNGHSKINLWQSVTEIGGQAIKYKFSSRIVLVPPKKSPSMVGAGVIKRHKKFITHTTLNPHTSALRTFTRKQKMFIFLLIVMLTAGFIFSTMLTFKLVIAALSLVYFVDVLFNCFVIVKSLHSPPEISPTAQHLALLKDKDLPMYTIMCPLYKEAQILPHFLTAIEKMDWPKDKLDVMLLLEEDDQETVQIARGLDLPKYVRIIVVPDSQPKTKPKACNYGLNFAKGELLVIYDAEDIPEPLQLKKVYLGFQQVAPDIKCLQAKLNYHNPHQNLLTRFFTAEYSLWFDVILTGLQSIQTALPLGGTSNHFKTQDLLELQGWDPFNVTEDCDLGVRLFKKGYKTAIVDSITLEEANSNWGNWLRQRSRWIKGYMQTYLIHMRNPLKFFRKNGFHAVLFQLIVGGKIAFLFINPIMWILTILYFTAYAIVGPTIEAVYPPVVFYMAVISLLFGNFMFIYYYMIGAAKREHWSVIKYVFFIPLYWLMVSMAACIALYQLIMKPHYWEKTVHGLHLKKAQIKQQIEETKKEIASEVITEAVVQKVPSVQGSVAVSPEKRRIFAQVFKKLPNFSSLSSIWKFIRFSKYRSASLLVFASIFANVLNMVTHLYLGGRLELAEFAEMNTFISLGYLLAIPYMAFGTTINHHVAKMLGQSGQTSWFIFWKKLLMRSLVVALIVVWIWLLSTPFLQNQFGWQSATPLLLFAPMFIFSITAVVNDSYLRGKLVFAPSALAAFIEPIVRLGSSVLFIELGYRQYVMMSIPLSVLSFVIITIYFVLKDRRHKTTLPANTIDLPWSFFSLAVVTRLSTIAFFTLDNILVAAFLSAPDAGRYGLLGLIGKMIFFSGSLITGFILPIVSHREGKGISSQTIFRNFMLLTLGIAGAAYVALGLGLPFLAPILNQEKLNEIAMYLPMYGLAILCYSLGQNIDQYHLAKKQYLFAWISFFVAVAQVVGLFTYNDSLNNVIQVMVISGVLNLVLLSIAHYWHADLVAPLKNIQDFFDLFRSVPEKKSLKKDHYRILMLNWRDTKHVWAGGAEVYVHETAKELVQRGHKVTVFSGNDGHSPRNEVIDGVQMVRRGGFFTIYFWAPMYYLLKFRGLFDIVIDSENGIPFFTPLFVRVPKILLIHHIHQEVFRTGLPLPLALVAEFIERVLMPLFYTKVPVITVSNSSKKAILSLGLSRNRDIVVIHPGVIQTDFPTSKKTKHPTFSYMGRLKPYKHIEVAIRAYSRIAHEFPDSTFYIAGVGESYKDLKDLIRQLKVQKQVQLLGKVSHSVKAKLLAESWFVVQPSMIEGWGITVIEANAAGTPVIASNVPGLRDSIVHDKTGILVEPKNVTAFSRAMRDLFTQTEKRNQLSKESTIWAKNFTWDNSTDQLLQLMQTYIPTKDSSTAKLPAFAIAKPYIHDDKKIDEEE